jgi:hypothetical protein
MCNLIGDAPYLQLGCRHLTLGLLAPYDVESIERIATHVRPPLAALVAP